MKLLIDMNLSPMWVTFLGRHGIEAVHWSQIGPAMAPDSQLMKHARNGGFVVFTHDLDFGKMLAMQRSDGPSVVQIRAQEVLPEAIGDLVVNALNAARPHLEAGAIVTIDPMQLRIRLLPI